MKRGAAGRIAQGSFDDRNLAVQTHLHEQVTITKGIQATASAVKTALDLRQASRQTAYDDAQQNATSAASNLSDAQLATQTLLDGIAKGVVAQTQAKKIRGKLGDLVAQAYQTAEAVCTVANAIDKLAADVQSRVGKNQLLSPFARNDAPQVSVDAQKALAAVLAALQDCVRAYAAASVAEALAAEPISLGEELLAILLEQEAVSAAERKRAKKENKPQPAKYYETIKTKVSALRLWSPDPETMHQVAAAVQEKSDKKLGLLNLLSAVKNVTQLRETVCNDALTVTILEDNKAQSDLDRATQKLALLNAALNAANAALV